MSCAPSAMVIDRSGDEFLMEKITPVDDSIPFRSAGGTSNLQFKNLNALTINPSKTEVYGGDTWINATIQYPIDDKSVEQTGWVKMSSRLTGECPSGPCELDLVKLRGFDFVMEEVVEVIDSTITTDSASIDESSTTDTQVPVEGE